MDSVSGVGVIDKGLAVLDALAAGPLDLHGLQNATGLPRATAHRLAVALERHGMVRRDPVGRFCLGFELIRLGRAASDAFPLADIARPTVQALRDLTGESAQLFVREGNARRCVLSFESTHGLRWIVPQGALLPLDLGSAGRLLGTPVSRSSSAYPSVESVEEREPGVASVSAAVLDTDGHIVAAVSLSGPVERLTRSPLRRFGSDVEHAARTITADCRSAR